MTRKEFEKYPALIREITRQEKRLKRLESPGVVASDVVSGSMDTFPYIAKNFKIVGYPEGVISARKKIIEASIKEASELAVKIEAYIGTLEDPRIREILRCKYLDCMKWDEVGAANNISTDYARQIVRKFFKEN